MQGKVHVAMGVLAVGVLITKYPTGFSVAGVNILPELALITVAAGSYAPDIDMGTTHAGRKHATASKVVSKVGGGHRGITHTLLVPAIVAAFTVFCFNYLAAYASLSTFVCSLLGGFLIGWLMHIYADLFNGKGVPLLWPLVKSKIHILDLPSSGFVPWVFVVAHGALIWFILYGGNIL